MQDNPEIEAIIDGSIKIAQTWKHEYVMTEHLLLSLIRHVPFRNTLTKYGCETRDQTNNAPSSPQTAR